MAYVLVVVGALMAAAGLYVIGYSTLNSRYDDYWTSLTAGATLFAGGMVTLALGFAVRALFQLRAALPLQGHDAPAVPVGRAEPQALAPLPGGGHVASAAATPQPLPPPRHEPAVLLPSEPPPAQAAPAFDEPPVGADLPAAHLDAAHLDPLEVAAAPVQETAHQEAAHQAEAHQDAVAHDVVVHTPVELDLPPPPPDAPLALPASVVAPIAKPSAPPAAVPDAAPQMPDDWLDRALAQLDQELPIAPRRAPTPPSPPTPDRPAEVVMPPSSQPAEPEPAHVAATQAAEPAPTSPQQAEPPAPAVIGRYEADGTSYVMYSDGSIEAQSSAGVYRFNSMAELKSFIEG